MQCLDVCVSIDPRHQVFLGMGLLSGAIHVAFAHSCDACLPLLGRARDSRPGYSREERHRQSMPLPSARKTHCQFVFGCLSVVQGVRWSVTNRGFAQ
jgi:hypothetical protein